MCVGHQDDASGPSDDDQHGQGLSLHLGWTLKALKELHEMSHSKTLAETRRSDKDGSRGEQEVYFGELLFLEAGRVWYHEK